MINAFYQELATFEISSFEFVNFGAFIIKKVTCPEGKTIARVVDLGSLS
jgi:hypothetical protein